MLTPPDNFLDEDGDLPAELIRNLWRDLTSTRSSLTPADLDGLRKWEAFEHDLITPHGATIRAIRIAAEQARLIGGGRLDYGAFAAAADDLNYMGKPFAWIALRALRGDEIVRSVKVPFAFWDEALGRNGGVIASLVLEVFAGKGEGQCAQHPENALRVGVDDRFRDSMAAAWQAALRTIPYTGNPPDGCWRIQDAEGFIEGASASGAAALGWHHALSGTAPDPGAIVMAEVKANRSLCGVEPEGLKIKLRKAKEDGRWDTYAIASSQKGEHEGVEPVSTLRALIQLRSKLTTGAIQWLRGFANELDETGWQFQGRKILASETAVDAFVYTKRRKKPEERQNRREGLERSAADEWVAHLYEQSEDWDEREKKRWFQVTQGARLRLGVRGAPGGGKTFLTRNSAVALARHSADRIERQEISLFDAPVPFWLTAKALASASGSNAAETVVNALERSRGDRGLLPNIHSWLLRASASPSALIVVDALDELVQAEVKDFQQRSQRLDGLPGRLIATCRSMHWDERVRGCSGPKSRKRNLLLFKGANSGSLRIGFRWNRMPTACPNSSTQTILCAVPVGLPFFFRSSACFTPRVSR